MTTSWGATLVALAPACFAPQPLAGGPCSSRAECPMPLVCSPATGTCERDSVPAGPGDPDDADRDGWPRHGAAPDCDDADPAIHPGRVDGSTADCLPAAA